MRRHMGWLALGLCLSAVTMGCGGGGSSSSCDRHVANKGADWFVLDSDVAAAATVKVDVTFRLKSTQASDAVFDSAAANTLQIWSSPNTTDVSPSYTASPAGQTVAPGSTFTYSFTVTLGAGDTNLGMRPLASPYGQLNTGTLDVASSCVTL